MNCCDYDCDQGDECPSRKATGVPCEHAQDFDPIPPIGVGYRLMRLFCIVMLCLVTAVWVVGLVGFLYARIQRA